MDVHEVIETALVYALAEDITDSALLERVCRKAADAVEALGATYEDASDGLAFAIYEDEDLEEASGDATCSACGRPELDCSRDPCAAVIADRES